MGGEEAKNADSTIDSVRRKLLEIGIDSINNDQALYKTKLNRWG